MSDNITNPAGINWRRCCYLWGLGLILSACHTPSEPVQPTENTDIQQAVEAARSIVTGEHLLTEIPESWLKVRDTKVANLHIAEYVPPDTTNEWREKISIEAMQGSDLPDPLVYLEGMANDQATVLHRVQRQSNFRRL